MTNIAENDVNNTEEMFDDTIKDLYLTFEIGDEEFAIEVVNVSEIIPVCAITYVPDMDDFVKGIFNLRGDIIPALSVRSRFNMPEIPYDELTCIIYIKYEEYDLGLIVDNVQGVITIPQSDISAPPSAKLSYSNQFVKNIGKVDKDVILMLDLKKFLFNN